MVAQRKRLLFTTAMIADSCVLTGYGTLDATTYFQVRDAVINAARAEPRAIIIDATHVMVATTPAMSAFVDAASYIAHRPEVPTALVCATVQGQKALRGNAISLRLPAYWSVEAAIAALLR